MDSTSPRDKAQAIIEQMVDKVAINNSVVSEGLFWNSTGYGDFAVLLQTKDGNEYTMFFDKGFTVSEMLTPKPPNPFTMAFLTWVLNWDLATREAHANAYAFGGVSGLKEFAEEQLTLRIDEAALARREEFKQEKPLRAAESDWPSFDPNIHCINVLLQHALEAVDWEYVGKKLQEAK